MFKKALLCAACAISVSQLSAQPTVPQLRNVGVGVAEWISQPLNITEDGYLIASNWFEYCTSITCWNDGATLSVRDSNMKTVLVLIFKREVLQNDQSKIEVESAVIDGNNDLVIAGRFLSDINFAPNDQTAVNLYGGYSYSSRSLFLAKYRLSDGHLYWVKTMAGEDHIFPGDPSINTDDQNNIIMYVNEGDDIDIDPGPAVKRVKKGVIAKFNDNGDLVAHMPAERTFGSTYKSFDRIDKKFYMLGIQDSTGTGKHNFVLQQYDTDNMKLVKSRKIGLFERSPNYPGYMRVNYSVDKGGNVWFLASYTESCSIGSYNKTLNGTEKEQILVKLDNNLNVTNVWPVHKTLNNATYAAGLGFDSLGNILIVGTVRDSIDVDLSGGTQWVKTKFPPPYTSGHYGTQYFNCYDKNMNLLWTKSLGDADRMWTRHVEFGHKQNIYVWGTAAGTINFDLLGSNIVTMPPNSKLPPSDMTETYVRYKWNTANYTTEIQEILSKKLNLSLYPNPATSVLNVRMDEMSGTEGRLTVIDISGRLLWTGSYNGEKAVQVPTASFAPGNYLLNVDIDGRERETRKFIKQ